MPRPKYDKDKVIADWKTGKYTERTLAAKHNISTGLAHKLVVGVSKNIAELVSAQIEVKLAQGEIDQKLALMNEHELSNFVSDVSEGYADAMFIRTHTHANVAMMMKKVDGTTSIMEHKLVQSTIKDARESLLGKEQPQTIVNNQNNVATQLGASKDWIEGKFKKINGTVS